MVSISPEALRSTVNDMHTVVNMVDRIAGTKPGERARGAIPEDLAITCHLRHENPSSRRKFLCLTSPVPSNNISSTEIINDSDKQLTDSQIYGMETTSPSFSKRLKFEVWRL